MRLHTLSVMVVLPLLLVVGGVLVITPKDILRQPILGGSGAAQAEIAVRTVETTAVTEPMEIVDVSRSAGDDPFVVAAVPAQRQIVPAVAEEALPVDEMADRRWITAGSLNMRSGPTATASLVASLPQGTEVTVIEIADRWALVTTSDGQQGWMATKFLGEEPPAQ